MKKKVIFFIIGTLIIRTIEFVVLKDSSEEICKNFIECTLSFFFTLPSYIFMIIIILTLVLLLISINKNNNLIYHDIQNEPENLKKYLIQNDYNQFIINRFDDYKKIQQDWMNFNYEGLRENLTDELFNQYSMQLETLKEKNEKNVISDIHPLGYKIIEVKEDNNQIQISIIISVSIIDYIEQNGNIIRGTNKPSKVKFQLDFVANNKNKNNCPNCGSILTDSASQVCQNCKSKISRVLSKYVLAKKRIISKESF